MEMSKSQAAYERACSVLPGGVNSPVRAFKAVGKTPFFADHGEGAYLYDIDGNRYVDYLLSWGPLMWGHAHKEIVRAVTTAAAKGTSFGVPTELETEMAETVMDIMPSIQKVRMVNSGTEATMSALRVARAYTKRPLIVKLEGCYHGHPDALLVKAGSGVATFSLPDSPGVPSDITKTTLTVPYNDVSALEALFAKQGTEIAALIMEPVAGNMGFVLPQKGYLDAARRITKEHGSLLIFDEVMTGFRVSLGGAQERFKIVPDMTTLGKVIGGGLPVGAYGGRADIMDLVAPSGPVYQAGTLSGNPLAMAAGLTSLRMLKEAAKEGLYERLEAYGKQIAGTFVQLGDKHGIRTHADAIGAMFGLFFHDGPVANYEDAKQCDTPVYAKFFHSMLENGVSLAPSQLEAGFLSAVHHETELNTTLHAMERAFESLQ